MLLLSGFFSTAHAADNNEPQKPGGNMVLMVQVPTPIGTQSSIEAIVQGGVLSLQTGIAVMFVPQASKNPQREIKDPNTYNKKTGLTPLHEECMKANANIRVIKKLVEKKQANVLLKTKAPYDEPGLKASQLARDNDHDEIANYLEGKEEE